jgi:hypothetical protein
MQFTRKKQTKAELYRALESNSKSRSTPSKIAHSHCAGGLTTTDTVTSGFEATSGGIEWGVMNMS